MVRATFEWLRSHLGLRLVVATLVALALFGYVVDIAVHGDLAGNLRALLVRIGPLAFVLTIAYFVLRGVTWWLLLRQVGLQTPTRPTVAAFSAGELTKSLPAGPYLEAYVLARLERLPERDAVSAAMATMGSDVMVGVVGFLTAMLLGMPGHDWFRWLLIAVAGSWVVIYSVIWVAIRWGRVPHRFAEARWFATIKRVASEVIDSARQLVKPVAVWPLLTSAAYLAVSALIVWLVLVAVGLPADPLAAIRIVTITSLANVLIPVPTDLGVTEITGVGILTVHGIGVSQAAIVMLGYRLLLSGSLTIIGLVTLGLVRDVFRERVARAR
jgi:uncharacterized protein (TIRG00374 family)